VNGSPLDDLKRELAGRGNAPARTGDLIRVISAVEQTLEEIGRHRDTLAETVEFVNQLQERLQIVDVLPTSAPFGAIIRLNTGPAAGRIPLYIGNGDSQPLSKIVPVAL
jgi:hypothetical protein